MTRRSGFMLLELAAAFAVLLIILLSASAMLSASAHHEAVLWEDCLASELALSALEHALTDKVCEATPAAGRDLTATLAPPGTLQPLADLTVTLHVAAGLDPALRELRACVTWRRAAGSLAGLPATLERTLIRRAQR